VISATSLSFTNSGSVTLSAVQVGNPDYDASPATNISFSVSKALASVFLSNTNQTYDGSAKNVSVTTVPAGQTVETTYNSSATLPTNAGSYTVVATISEAMYQGGTTGTLTISKASQTVNFENIGDQLTTNIVALSATATSGLSVTNFSVVSGPAVISAGTNLTFSGAGIVKIVASQAGDANWNAAPTVTNTVTVSKATPSITSWPTASALMHGKTLAFSTLSSGAASVDGAFAFTVPNTIPAMTASQSVTFTPIDANRYNSVTGSVSVTVIAKPAITAQPISAVVTMGQAAGLSVSNSGSAPLSYQWLKDGVILLGQTNSTLNFASFKFVDSGSYSVVITNALGMVISVPASLSVRNAPLWAMGMNGSGQLGNGTTDSSNLPVQMASNVVVAACGGDHSLFVNADGTLWGMGLNYDGQLGNAMAGWEADLPVQVASNVVGVAAGFSHSLFVKTDGTLWAMGLNNYGQLGNGTTTSTNRPVQVSSNVVAVAAGYFHSLFVKADGTLWAMGWNRNGRLGNGTTVNARLPVQVASNVVTVASGNDHSLFVKADGTLWGMGDNSLGQLGVDVAADTTRPVLVMSNVVSAAAGYAHTLIIKADGTLWGMGNNYESELGLGVEVDTTRPVLVTNHVVAAAGGTYHSLFVKANGTLWGMGNNSSGQLGDGTWETTNQPVLVNGGGLIAVSVARGSSAYHSLAIASTLPMVSVSNLTVTVGQMTNFTAIVTGDGLFTYQWQFNGTNIVDATNDCYTISSATVSDAGDYVVLVTGTYGTATSAIATLTVNKMSQTVNFPNIGDQFTTSRVTLIATASSGLSVTNFSVVSGPAVISAGSVSFTNSGSVTLSAVQDGDSSYSASPAETISFMVLASSYTLTVTSAHGGSDPAGTNSYDTPISVMITNSPIFVETTQYVCTGWTGTGSVPASGTTTNTGLFAMTQESTLVWLWTTNYLLKVETMGNGSVSTSNVWLACGTPFQISVTPDPYYHFAGWSGHAEGETSNPLTLAMNSARSVTANFVPNLTPNTSTPEYWLAQYGLTNFNTDALADADLDGMKTWQEYIAGTDPTNAASKFQITQTQMEGALGTNFVIRWSSVAGKLYAVDATTNLLEGFPLNRGRDILATPNENVLTIRVDRASQEFFRIRIQP
jgi:alpha-tubulin suppressor-like RCC1 family protein